MKQEKYGFVYIWYDRKHKRYYIGSHWGHLDDGYICSSRWMRKAFRRRPEDFKRRILVRVTDRSVILDEEQKWLDKVKRKDRYYNLCYTTKAPWWDNEETRLTTAQKISRSNTGKQKGKIISDEHRKAISKAHKGKKRPQCGTPRTEEQKQTLREAIKSRPHRLCEACLKEVSVTAYNRWHGGSCGKSRAMSDEQKAKLSLAKTGKPGPNKGRKMTSVQIAAMSLARTGKTHSEETKRLMSEKHKGMMSAVVKKAWIDGKYATRGIDEDTP